MIGPPVRLAYAIVGAGWARLEIAVGERQADARVTCLTPDDPPTALLRALLLLLAADAPADDEAVCRFADEPGETVLDLRRAGERLRVLVHWTRDRDEDVETLLDATCSPVTFAAAVEGALARLLGEHGEAGYEARWGRPFPTAGLAALRRALAARTG